jgi:hypothetical protein
LSTTAVVKSTTRASSLDVGGFLAARAGDDIPRAGPLVVSASSSRDMRDENWRGVESDGVSSFRRSAAPTARRDDARASTTGGVFISGKNVGIAPEVMKRD